MNDKTISPFDSDMRKALLANPDYAAEFFEELSERPLPIQLALLRHFLGMTQNGLAEKMGLKQTHVSRLEKDGSDHLISLYQRAAKKIGARLVILPNSFTLIPKKDLRRLAATPA